MRPNVDSEAEVIIQNTLRHMMKSRIKEILEQRNDFMDTFRWAVQTVHQAHHEGVIQSCPKNTCESYRRCVERVGVNWPPTPSQLAYPNPKTP